MSSFRQTTTISNRASIAPVGNVSFRRGGAIKSFASSDFELGLMFSPSEFIGDAGETKLLGCVLPPSGIPPD